MSTTMSTSSTSSLEPLFAFLSYSLATAESAFYRLPGSAVIVRYVKSSHQNDPGRTLLELILIIFAIRTLLQSRTRTDKQQKHFIEFNEKEIDELVADWNPEPLTQPLSAEDQADIACVPIISGPTGPKPRLVVPNSPSPSKPVINLATYNPTGLAGSEYLKSRAISTLRKYGLGSCGPTGFYGMIDVHLELEKAIAGFLGADAAILYAQALSTVASVIPAFCKRGDLVLADRHASFAIRKGLEISRATVRWYEHNDLASLEEVMMGIERDERRRARRRGCLSSLTRMLGLTHKRMQAKYIVTEGIFERDGAMVDLPKLVELKNKYKYRLILDESMSFGTVGRTGRGLTELYNVPATKVDMIVGSVANALGTGGGFCAGAEAVVAHQRINAPASVFSASLPALLAVAATEAINILSASPSILESLHENARAARAALDKIDGIEIPSHPASAVIHVCLKPSFWGWREPATDEGTPTLSSPGLLHPSSASALVPPALSKSTSSKSTSSKSGHSLPSYSSSVSPTSQVYPPPSAEQIAFEESILQEIADEALGQGVLVVRARRLRGQEVNEPRASLKLCVSGGQAATGAYGGEPGGGGLSKKEIEKACSVLKSAIGKVASRRR
ncbi:hypothetical protein HGRIS_012216 [Hohenbuehelia grisea]|uniref:serine C-palmitoyltransferase n=1 Tax=Hohenbuehelia grisea TaxID=104357 RepID=A0ABR3IRM6_9AGAR